jgi:hypothetical protein
MALNIANLFHKSIHIVDAGFVEKNSQQLIQWKCLKVGNLEML